MIFTHDHFIANLSPVTIMAYWKRLERLSQSLETILIHELSVRNKILEVRLENDVVDHITVLLQKSFIKDYDNEQLSKLITTDVHDHGVYYITKTGAIQSIIAPYSK